MDFIKNTFPKKVELHVHLDGAIRHTTAWDFVRKKGLKLPGDGTFTDFKKSLIVTEPRDLNNFLSPYKHVTPAYEGDMEAAERMAYEYCEDAFNQGIIYAEVRYSPHKSLGEKYYTQYGVPGLESYVENVQKGLQKGCHKFNIKVNQILTAYHGWPYGNPQDVLNLCQKFDYVVGMDLCTKQPPCGRCDEAPINKELSKLFDDAKRLGVKTTIHAGESSGPKAIERAKDYYKADRIGHGYHVIDDASLYQKCLNEKVHFECCPWSSILTGAVKEDIKEHPIARFAKDGANFSISSDDPMLTGKYICDDYDLVMKLGLTNQQIINSNINAANASFLNDVEKNGLLKELKEIYNLNI